MTKMFQSFIANIMDSLETLVFTAALYLVVYIFIAQPSVVQGISMEPTLLNNERLITNKLVYRFRNPQRGDIIVLRSPLNPDLQLVKRVIGIGGDTLTIQNGSVYLNNKKITEPYVSSKTFTYEGGAVKEGEKLTVPSQSLFVLGDNRIKSADSRLFGTVSLTSVVGQAVYRFFPPNRIGFLNHYSHS